MGTEWMLQIVLYRYSSICSKHYIKPPEECQDAFGKCSHYQEFVLLRFQFDLLPVCGKQKD